MNIESRLERLEEQLEQLQQSEACGHYYDPRGNVIVIKTRYAVIVLPDNGRDATVREWPLPPPEMDDRLERFRTQKQSQENGT